MDAARKPKRKRADKEAKDDEVGGVAEIAKKMKPKQQQPHTLVHMVTHLHGTVGDSYHTSSHRFSAVQPVRGQQQFS